MFPSAVFVKRLDNITQNVFLTQPLPPIEGLLEVWQVSQLAVVSRGQLASTHTQQEVPQLEWVVLVSVMTASPLMTLMRR